MARYPIPPSELFTIEDVAERPAAADFDVDIEAVETRLPPNSRPRGNGKKTPPPFC
jgi:hypothetical protein